MGLVSPPIINGCLSTDLRKIEKRFLFTWTLCMHETNSRPDPDLTTILWSENLWTQLITKLPRTLGKLMTLRQTSSPFFTGSTPTASRSRRLVSSLPLLQTSLTTEWDTLSLTVLGRRDKLQTFIHIPSDRWTDYAVSNTAPSFFLVSRLYFTNLVTITAKIFEHGK